MQTQIVFLHISQKNYMFSDLLCSPFESLDPRVYVHVYSAVLIDNMYMYMYECKSDYCIVL